jgi:nitrate reductase gamma subunit
MGGIVLFIFYGSILFFAIVSILKIVQYATAPLHLRWELYQGSSVYELLDGGNKVNLNFLQKLGKSLLDILFLKEYFHRNRKFWIFLYLFHLGIYLLILWHAWLFVRAIMAQPESASIGSLILGDAATALAFLGVAGILTQRIFNKDLKVHYSSIHYIKWIVMMFTLLEAYYAVHVHFNADVPALLKYVNEQVTFQDLNHKLHTPAVPSIHVLFVSIWLMYFPFSHIMMLLFRYYHYFRWDDKPNLRGSQIEKKVREVLDQPITWSAPHIQSRKKWREVVTEVQDSGGTQKA